MALNLLKAGFDLTVHNRTRSKVEELVARGAKAAASPGELAGKTDVVLSCLADVPSTLEAFLGAGGALEAARPGQVLVDHATVELETSRRMHEACRQKGAFFLDAPISGGPGGAADATLSIMAGGEMEPFEKVLPVFQAMGKTVLFMGGPGSGTATKLVNQLLVGIHTLAACEALTLARKVGVNLEKLIYVLERSWGQSRMLERNAASILTRSFGPSSVPLRNLLKDLSIILELARAEGVSLPAGGEAHRVFSALAKEGLGACDIAAACLYLEKNLEQGE
jgi:3-hydroxyisobutyrate dehydrogenase-like beta-hydroxyacid dehydrogenase